MGKLLRTSGSKSRKSCSPRHGGLVVLLTYPLQWAHAIKHGAKVSYYEEPSDIEFISMRNPLETAAALNIGLLLFAFSRLEVSLDRFLDRVSPVAESPPERRAPMPRLMTFVNQLSDASLRERFRQWTVRAGALEELRNAIARGRWLPDPRRDCLLLDAPATGKLEYRVSELAASLALIKDLQASFHELCTAERK